MRMWRNKSTRLEAVKIALILKQNSLEERMSCNDAISGNIFEMFDMMIFY